jgi:hypothetical protein
VTYNDSLPELPVKLTVLKLVAARLKDEKVDGGVAVAKKLLELVDDAPDVICAKALCESSSPCETKTAIRTTADERNGLRIMSKISR